MELKKVLTDNAPAAIGPYSQAIVAGDYVFTSGQIGVNPATNEMAGEDITAQAEQAMKNLVAVLTAAGTTPDKVVKCTCFLSDMANFAAFNAVYEKYLPHKPGRSCFAVKELPRKALLEVEAIAAAK